MTATAAPSSVCDISNLLNFGNDYRLFRYPSRRNNISYSVQFFKKKASSLKYIQNYVTVDSSGDCGIIYCLKPGDVHEVAHDLTHEAVNKPRLSITYGKGLDKGQRKESLQDWLSGKTDVLVATKAAGTGLDKNNVRYVLHLGCPDSVEEYYQQSGRAGRDGLPSEALLLTMEEDRHAHVRHISETEDESQREKAIHRLHQMVSYCKTDGCRKKFIDQYLGDELSDPCLNSCDNCRKPKDGGHINGKDYAIQMLKCTQSVLNIVPKPNHANIIKTFTGSLSKEIKQLKLNELPEHGMGKKLSYGQGDFIVQYLISKEVFKEVVPYKDCNRQVSSYICLGRNAALALRGELPLEFKIPKI